LQKQNKALESEIQSHKERHEKEKWYYQQQQKALT
jgi:hypothetical protein